MPKRPNGQGGIQHLGGDTYRINVAGGYDATGKLRRKFKTIHGTRADAEAALLALKVEAGKVVDTYSGVTLETYWRAVFPTRPSIKGTPRAASTMSYYTKTMDKYVLPVIGHVELEKLTHAQIRDCILRSGSPNNVKRTLSAVLRCAFDDGMMPEKPFERRVPVRKSKREQVLPWTRFEAAGALSKLREADTTMYLYAILGMSGLRREEALGIRPVDVRRETSYSYTTGEPLEVMTITVAQTYTDQGGLRDEAKNDFSLRTVPVLPSLRDDLDAIIKARLSAAEDKHAAAHERLVPLSGNALIHKWRRTLAKVDVRYIPPDMLRHTTDTLALTAGVSPDLNDKMHGRIEHASTYRHYFRPDIAAMDEAARRIDDLLSDV